MGPLRFSVTTLMGAAAALACAGAAAGHRNDDFEITVLPAYQHFRPSIRRQDQYAVAFDGRATLHSMAFAFRSEDRRVGKDTRSRGSKKVSRMCIFIGHSTSG